MRSVDQDLADSLRWYFAAFERQVEEQLSRQIQIYVQEEDQGQDPPLYSYFLNAERRHSDVSLGSLFAYIVWDVIGSLPRTATDFLFLHAGAVELNGTATLLPADANHGKSSLVVELLRLGGFSYLSDEYAAIDPVTGRVHPFQKPLHLTEDALPLLGGITSLLRDRNGIMRDLAGRFLHAGDLGVDTGRASPVRRLIFPSSQWNGPPRLTQMTRAEAVEELARNCLNLDVYGERGLILLGRVCEETTALRLDGGSPAERAQAVGDLTVTPARA